MAHSLGQLMNVQQIVSKDTPLQQKQATTECRMRKGMRMCVRAKASGDGNQSGKQYGLGGPGSWFGFGKNQERLVGRFAMIGFTAALVEEVITGKGIFGQLGLDPLVVRFPVLLGFSFLFVAGLLGGYVVIQNPPDTAKAPANAGDGIPRDPLKTFDAKNLDALPTYTRGGIVERPSGQKGREPYVSDLDLPSPPPPKE